MEKAIFACVIGKNEHILTKNINPILKLIAELENQKKYDAFRSIHIVIDGYNDSTDELFEIKEVRAWVQKLINRVPHLLYFVENNFAKTEQTVMLCLNNLTYMHDIERKPITEFETIDELPVYMIKIDVHRKSYREMCAALRNYGKKRQDTRRVEDLIEEMNDRYGIE